MPPPRLLAGGAKHDLQHGTLEGLTAESQRVFDAIPESIRKQLLMDRDPHGNVQVGGLHVDRCLTCLLLLPTSVRLPARLPCPAQLCQPACLPAWPAYVPCLPALPCLLTPASFALSVAGGQDRYRAPAGPDGGGHPQGEEGSGGVQGERRAGHLPLLAACRCLWPLLPLSCTVTPGSMPAGVARLTRGTRLLSGLLQLCYPLLWIRGPLLPALQCGRRLLLLARWVRDLLLLLPCCADLLPPTPSGRAAAALAARGATGVIVSITGLHLPPREWEVNAQPLVGLMNIEMRKGERALLLMPRGAGGTGADAQRPFPTLGEKTKNKTPDARGSGAGKPAAVIEKALVRLDGPVFKALTQHREDWAVNDRYRSPGPCQFYGPLADDTNITLKLEYGVPCVL